MTAGASARGRVTLSFSLLGGGATTCVYRGTGYRAFGGKRYVLKPMPAGLRAPRTMTMMRTGSGRVHRSRWRSRVTTMTADRFHLRVERGDNHFPATVIHLALPGPQPSVTTTRARRTGVIPSPVSSPTPRSRSTTATNAPPFVRRGHRARAHADRQGTVCRGKANFHDRTLAGLGGTGRACADCHMPSERFQPTPAAALARFNAMTSSGEDDPLSRPIHVNDFRVNGAAAQDYTNLTVNGLIRVTHSSACQT